MPNLKKAPGRWTHKVLADRIVPHASVLVADQDGRPLFDTSIAAERARQRTDGCVVVKGRLYRAHRHAKQIGAVLHLAWTISLEQGDMTLVRERRPLPAWAEPDADHRVAA